MQTTKIIDGDTNIAHHVITAHCSVCKALVIIPEPYWTWWLRTFNNCDMSLMPVKCREHGGLVLDPNIYYSTFWEQNSNVETASCDSGPSAIVTVPEKDKTKFVYSYDDDYEPMGFHGYTGKYSFYSAHKALRAFIKE